MFVRSTLATLAVLATLAGAAAAPAQAADTTSDSSQAFTFGVIGDIPYGAAEIAKFPSHVQDLNADQDLKFVAHVGDIKNGSSVCSDEYFAYIRSQFDTFTHPLVYTPGDNEWVDCHRTNNGAYNPLERLDKIREVFFNEPGKTLGATMPVKTQEKLGLPEDVRFTPLRTWRSPRTGVTYPVAMRVTAGEATLDLVPLQDDQELDSRASVGTIYWEGAVRAVRDGKPAGRGYLELTGYGGALRI